MEKATATNPHELVLTLETDQRQRLFTVQIKIQIASSVQNLSARMHDRLIQLYPVCARTDAVTHSVSPLVRSVDLVYIGPTPSATTTATASATASASASAGGSGATSIKRASKAAAVPPPPAWGWHERSKEKSHFRILQKHRFQVRFEMYPLVLTAAQSLSPPRVLYVQTVYVLKAAHRKVYRTVCGPNNSDYESFALDAAAPVAAPAVAAAAASAAPASSSSSSSSAAAAPSALVVRREIRGPVRITASDAPPPRPPHIQLQDEKKRSALSAPPAIAAPPATAATLLPPPPALIASLATAAVAAAAAVPTAPAAMTTAVATATRDRAWFLKENDTEFDAATLQRHAATTPLPLATASSAARVPAAVADSSSTSAAALASVSASASTAASAPAAALATASNVLKSSFPVAEFMLPPLALDDEYDPYGMGSPTAAAAAAAAAAAVSMPAGTPGGWVSHSYDPASAAGGGGGGASSSGYRQNYHHKRRLVSNSGDLKFDSLLDANSRSRSRSGSGSEAVGGIGPGMGISPEKSEPVSLINRLLRIICDPKTNWHEPLMPIAAAAAAAVDPSAGSSGGSAIEVAISDAVRIASSTVYSAEQRVSAAGYLVKRLIDNLMRVHTLSKYMNSEGQPFNVNPYRSAAAGPGGSRWAWYDRNDRFAVDQIAVDRTTARTKPSSIASVVRPDSKLVDESIQLRRSAQSLFDTILTTFNSAAAASGVSSSGTDTSASAVSGTATAAATTSATVSPKADAAAIDGLTADMKRLMLRVANDSDWVKSISQFESRMDLFLDKSESFYDLFESDFIAAKQSCDWPHSPAVLDMIQRAGFHYVPVWGALDRCVCLNPECQIRIAGWNDWLLPDLVRLHQPTCFVRIRIETADAADREAAASSAAGRSSNRTAKIPPPLSAMESIPACDDKWTRSIAWKVGERLHPSGGVPSDERSRLLASYNAKRSPHFENVVRWAHHFSYSREPNVIALRNSFKSKRVCIGPNGRIVYTCDLHTPPVMDNIRYLGIFVTVESDGSVKPIPQAAIRGPGLNAVASAAADPKPTESEQPLPPPAGAVSFSLNPPFRYESIEPDSGQTALSNSTYAVTAGSKAVSLTRAGRLPGSDIGLVLADRDRWLGLDFGVNELIIISGVTVIRTLVCCTYNERCITTWAVAGSAVFGAAFGTRSYFGRPLTRLLITLDMPHLNQSLVAWAAPNADTNASTSDPHASAAASTFSLPITLPPAQMADTADDMESVASN